MDVSGIRHLGRAGLTVRELDALLGNPIQVWRFDFGPIAADVGISQI